MKSKILFRLISYFVSSFIVFALIIGIIFTTFFSRYNTDVLRTELEERAENVANTLSEMLENNVGGMARQGSGYGAYLRFIEDISMNEVWVVDRDFNPITCEDYQNEEHIELQNKVLPDWARVTVLRAINEKTLISENYSSFREESSIITATPIVLSDGSVIGAALLHSHISQTDNATRNGIVILFFSIAAAVLISVIIAVILSSRFTKPLNKMKIAALEISGGDYSARTGVKQLDEIGDLASAMDDMADKLDASSRENRKLDKLRRDFIANISHELRTPVTVIRGSLEALCDGVVTDIEKVEEYYAQMLSESVFLERLVSDLIDLARLQNTDFAIEVQDVDLRDISEDVIRSMRRIAEQKQVNLTFTFEGDHFVIHGDYARLRQMLIIVLDNAIKFSSKGNMVTMILLKSETMINLIIRDEGVGINPSDLPYIFERFYMQRSEQNKTGTGLGLSIAKQIADRHGASVKVTSDRNKGTEFIFTFPNENNDR